MAMKPKPLIGLMLCAVVLCLLPGVASAGAPPTALTLEQRVATLEKAVATLQAQVTALQGTLAAANNVLALSPYVTVDAGGHLVRFAGVNLQLVNGTGQTDRVNGRGNLILGYDIARNDNTAFCSGGRFTGKEPCERSGQTWAVSHKTGSHYLVIGDRNNYAQYGGWWWGPTTPAPDPPPA